jgi:hypothetical protein
MLNQLFTRLSASDCVGTRIVSQRFSGRRRLAFTAALMSLATLALVLLPIAKSFGNLPSVTFVPANVVFPNQLVGTTGRAITVAMTNKLTTPLTVTSITASSPFSETDTCVGMLAAGGHCNVTVIFSPTSLGKVTSALTINDNAAGSPQTVNLTGTGVDVTLAPPTLNFPSQPVNAPPVSLPVTLTNSDPNSLTISQISATGDFSINNAATTCGSSLISGASCTISVTFAPTVGGLRSGTLSVADTGVGTPQTLNLSGTGLTVNLLPVSMTFGSTANPQNIGTRSPAQIATLTNYGSAPLTIQPILSPTNFVESDNCGSSLAGGQSCAISVLFLPTISGAVAGSLQVIESGYPDPKTIKLTGTSTGPGLVSMSVTPGNWTLAVGQAQAFSAIGNFSDGSVQNLSNTVVWTSSATTVASIVNNVATAVAGGNTTISASSGTVSASSALIVSNVTLSPRAASVTFTQTEQFQATVQSEPSKSVTWDVDGTAGGNSAVGTISSSGLYTPPAAVGAHQITAVSESDPTQAGTAQVFVTDSPGVATYQNDNLETGQNLTESVLNPGNVNAAQFGKLFSLPVDGFLYGQPLYQENVSIPGLGYHNVVYVATEADSVYAFDADGLVSTPLWHVNFTNPAGGITTVPAGLSSLQCSIGPQTGVTGTPVIDPTSGTLYVAARTQEPVSLGSKSKVDHYHLHALDITTGAEKFGGPVDIQASVPGTGTGNDGMGNLPFRLQYENNRPGLLLVNGVVYIGFGAFGNEGATFYYHHGWVLAYDAQTLSQVAAYTTTPNSWGGSLWMSGGAPAADASGNIYFMTGNGWYDADTGSADYGNSFVKLSLAGNSLTVPDYFTPYNADTTLLPDEDLGSGGVLLLPDQPEPTPHLAVGDGKEGTIYLINRDNMGQYNPVDNSGALQSLTGATGLMGGKPSYFQGRIYLTDSTRVHIYTLTNGLLAPNPLLKVLGYGYPGATASFSANGSTYGIMWMMQGSGQGCTKLNGNPTVLHAYDPISASELYNSAQSGTRDTAGPAVKFTIPTIANGKVYVGTQTAVYVYGLLP